MAIWLTKGRATPGPVFGSMGKTIATALLWYIMLTVTQTTLKGSVSFLTRMDPPEGPFIPLIDRYRYSNGRHPYSFPRVVAMLGDGKTSYDLDNDGDSNAIGSCSVRRLREAIAQPPNLIFFQAFFRRTNIATKLKITYLRDGLLDVCFLPKPIVY
jgi:mannose-binding lectin 2